MRKSDLKNEENPSPKALLKVLLGVLLLFLIPMFFMTAYKCVMKSFNAQSGQDAVQSAPADHK